MGQKIIISDFLEGVDSDSDVLRVKRTKLRDSLNTVVVTIDGKSVVRTPIPGFNYEFSLTPGYQPLGCCQYNGILYLISWNPGNGNGEIGSYPSPNPGCAGGLSHQYRPLNNFTATINPLLNPSAPRLPLRTPLFQFDCTHQIDMEPRDDYDGSVNLYFADFKNPLRFINSGFDQAGNCNPRLYWNGSFPNGIEANGETCKYVQADIIDIPNNSGQVQAGNFWFHFRYTTNSFNPTSFLGHTGPAQISPDADNTAVRIDGAAGLALTTKSVKLHLSNLDVNYPFIEMAVVYFYNNVIDVALIDNLYPIDALTGTADIEYTGLENIIDGFGFDQLVSKKITDDIPKTITQIENQLWQANMKSRANMSQDLINFANLIKPKFDDTLQIEDKNFNLSDTQDKFQHKDWRNTAHNVGYFRGEIYAYALVAVFTSGRKSKPIPLAGGDDYYGAVAYNNTKGIYRFPNHNVSNPRTNLSSNGHGQLNVLGIKFDTSACPPGFNQFINDNVCGFYFVRTKRKPNLIYQGMVLNCYTSGGSFVNDAAFGIYFTPNYCCNFSESDTSNWIPLWNVDSSFGTDRGVFPWSWYQHTTVGSDSEQTMTTGFATRKTDKFGIYSPDHYFIKALKDGLYPVIKIGIVNHINGANATDYVYQNGWGANTYAYPVAIIDIAQTAYVDPSQSQNNGKLKLYNIAEWERIANNGFVSYFEEGQGGGSSYLFFWDEKSEALGIDYRERYNREFATSHYIGADMDTSIPDIDTVDIDAEFAGPNGLEKSMVNIYNIDPLTLSQNAFENWYDVDNEKYYEISDFIPKSQFFSVTGATVFYRGDCFLQRTYHRQLLDPLHGNSGGGDGQSPFGMRTHGIVHSIISENAVNTAMRFTESSTEYYPEQILLPTLIGDLLRESKARNAGYDNTLPVEFQYAVNLNTLLATQNRFPTRIRYSAKHVHNSLRDGYKISEPDWYRDFDYRMGEIICIASLNGALVSIQESGMNIHIINERAATQDSTGEDLLIGKGDILSQKFKNITDQIGTQNQWSVYHTPLGLTGVDAFKAKIWFLKNDFSLDIISDSQFYSTRIVELLNRRATHSDILHKMGDNPVCDEGIVTGYDFKTGNIFYTFVLTDFNSLVRPHPKIRETHCFNEKYWQWMGKMSFTPSMYPVINNDLFSFAPNQNEVWRHNQPLDSSGNPNYATFYGTSFNSFIKWVANENPEITKVFDNLNLPASGDIPFSIKFATEDQFLEYNPFIQNNLAHDGVYKENQWKIPIGTAVIINPTQSNIYAIGSNMRGKYLEIELTYNTRRQFYVKSALLYNRISKI